MSSWTSFIERAPAAHAVQVYDDLAELARIVGVFLSAGFQQGAPAILIATDEHRQRFENELAARGWDAALLEGRGLLARFDAEETLAAFMDEKLPSRERFEQTVGGLVDEIGRRHPDRTLRAFGEMVDVLWRRGQERAALALEELWNELAETRSFALLCGYQLDIFDLEVQQAALPDVLRLHSHARTVAEPSRLAAAVDQALAELVGPDAAARIYLDVAENVPRGSTPRAQAVLGWLSSGGSPLAGEVLERVRMHYVRLRSAPTAA